MKNPVDFLGCEPSMREKKNFSTTPVAFQERDSLRILSFPRVEARQENAF